MSFRRHEHYRAVNLPHLAEVPSHWDLLPNKALFSQVHRSVGEDWSRTQLLSLSLRGIVARDIDSGEGKYPSDFGTYQCVEPGDLVFCLFDMDETPRTVGLSALAGMITGAYDVVRCRPRAVPSYVHYYYLYIDSFKGLRPFYTGLRKVVRPPTFMAIGMPVPPIAEQSDIASFLDQETSKIDALISEQQRLIELLKEKRQAVISHAVTKGLNPDVRMKPSGVEWLGEVPEHWSLIPLKHCVKLSTDKAEESSFPVALENVQSWTGTFVPGEGDFSGEGVAFQAGDILFGKLRPYLAKAFLADKAGEAVGDFHVLRPHAGVFGRWLQYRILSREFIAEINSASFGSKMPRVSWEFMGRMPIPLPPMAEQQAVAHKLNSELAVIDELVVDADKAIALLQERRTALISAAVTGKIDVRNYAATQKDAA